MSNLKHGAALAVVLAYALMKLYFAYRWWFDGSDFWAEAFRALPSGDYGYLLGAKWIGTRNLAFGGAILLVLLLRRPGPTAALLVMGVATEFFDGFWLAYGKYAVGFQESRTDFYMIGAFVWVAVCPSPAGSTRARAPRRGRPGPDAAPATRRAPWTWSSP